VVFNGALPAASEIRRRIKEEYDRWRLAKLFRGDVFDFVEPVPPCILHLLLLFFVRLIVFFDIVDALGIHSM
jgi:hypothetical protein